MTQQELKNLLHYDPETGHFTWLAFGPNYRNSNWGKRAGTVVSGKLRYIRIAGIPYSEANLAWFYMTGNWPEFIIDHKNRDGGDNRWLNLREATIGENARNKEIRSDNTSGIAGVSWHKNYKKYHAYINVRGIRKQLGFFENLDDAVKIRKIAELQYFKDFAPSLNEARSE